MKAGLRAVRLGTAETRVERQGDGSLVVASREPLNAFPRVLTERLAHWASAAPDRVFLAKRPQLGAQGWVTVTYAQAWAAVQSLGQALIDRGLSADRPVAILSENDIEHGLLSLAGQHVGIPTAPVSTAYSLVSTDFGKLRHVFDILTPGLVFVADDRRYQRALDAVLPQGVEVVATRNPPAGHATCLFSDLAATPVTTAVAAAHARIEPDGIAKFLFTSGSTGIPKGVINTNRMVCANQQMILQSMPFIGEEPPVMLDWLPWSHTFGGNHNFGIALYNGGTLYLDDGKPLPGAIDETIRNLREIAPTIYFNVPKGFEGLLPSLENDRDLRRTFFSQLKMLFYAGAGLAQHVWDAYRDLALKTCGERIFMSTSLGSTETAPAALCPRWEADRPGQIGVPMPGVEIKLVPNGRKQELRLKGPSITPGYWRQPEVSRASFDEDGFYKMGDAVLAVDLADFDQGFLFDGRIAEDFKLATGTWISVGQLRTRAVGHFVPFMRDAVVTGHDRDDIGLLVVPDIERCRELCVDFPPDAPAADVLAHHAVRTRFADLLASFAAQATGSASRVVRALLMEEPPSLDAGEITDKGSLNQRVIIDRRSALVEELYGQPASPRVITIPGV